MPRKPSKPAKIVVGRIRARAIRGPHRDGSGRWYWRAEINEDASTRTVWSGWGLPTDVERDLAVLVAQDRLDAAERVHDVRTVRDLLECYIAAQRTRPDLRPATVRVRTFAARRLVGAIGDVRLACLNMATVEEYRNIRGRSGYAGRTTILDIEVLRSAWLWGRPRGLVEGEPPPRVRVKAEPVQSRYTPSPGEVAAVLHELAKLDRRKGLDLSIRSDWPWMMILLHFATGARLSEIGGLRVSDYDHSRGILSVNGKTGSREVPVLDPLVLDRLRDWTQGRPGDAWLLMVSPMGAKGIGKYLNAACEAAGVPRFTTHALRRLTVDTLARSGVDVATAADILGHSPAVMLNVYRTVSAADRRAGVAKASLGRLPRGEVVPLRERGSE